MSFHPLVSRTSLKLTQISSLNLDGGQTHSDKVLSCQTFIYALQTWNYHSPDVKPTSRMSLTVTQTASM